MINKKGYTLVELLVVISLLALLLIITIPKIIDLFNESKKDTFVTEVKEIYKTATSTYLNEYLKGNSINELSSDGPNKLESNSDDLTYYIQLEDGNIKYIEVSNGEYCIQTRDSATLINSEYIKKGTCDENRPDQESDPILSISSSISYLDKTKLQNFVKNNKPNEIIIVITGHDSGANISNDENYPIYAWMDNKTMYISAKDKDVRVKAPVDSTMLFCTDTYATNPFKKVSKVDLTYLDTSEVVNMKSMLAYIGYDVTGDFSIIGLEHFVTSNVTNMSGLFFYSATNPSSVSLGDISKWDTSKVTDMSNMFSQVGRLANSFIINLSEWNTSKVTDMQDMFRANGAYSTTWKVGNLSKWDTSNVTNMSDMFSGAGSSYLNWSIGDISNWNTSKVTDMSYMFAGIGNVDTLNLNNFDTSKVTDMSGMFINVKTSNNDEFKINGLSNFDTSEVTDMEGMFSGAGINSSIFNLDLRNFNTSKTKNISSMFFDTGLTATYYSLNLSSFNTSNTIGMWYVFNESFDNVINFSIKIPNINGNTQNLLVGKNTYSTLPDGFKFTLID